MPRAAPGHGLFMYNRNDQFVGRGLGLYGQWCEFELQVVRRFIAPGDTVIDAGTNVGTHTVAFAEMVGPAGRVHAFEPQRRNFHMRAGNVALNALDKVICHRQAVGDAAREIALPPLPPPDMPFNFGALALSRASADGERAARHPRLACAFHLSPDQDRHRRHGAAGA